MAKDYENIPVEPVIKKKILALCKAYGMNERSQGIVVANLVNAEYEKWAAIKLIEPVDSTKGTGM